MFKDNFWIGLFCVKLEFFKKNFVCMIVCVIGDGGFGVLDKKWFKKLNFFYGKLFFF